MKKQLFIATFVSTVSLFGGCQLTSVPDDGRVQVNFENPERYTDVQRRAYEETDTDTLEILRTFIQREARRYLEPGQSLTMTFRDVDLAGDFEPWRGPRAMDIRIVKDLYPPRVEFDYALFDSTGAQVAGGPVELMDMAYLMTVGPGSHSEPLYHEKELLRDWFGRAL